MLKEKKKLRTTNEKIIKVKKQKSKGITLIALVITIIVLLILAGVTIATLTGDNGILTRANEAKVETEEAKEDELRKLTALEAATNIENQPYTDKNGDTATIPAGFAVSQVEGENIIEDGLVIIDANGNEFVWIPVNEFNEFKRKDGYRYGELQECIFTSDKLSDGKYYEPTGNGISSTNEVEKMYKSVKDNKGFYFGRYETGKDKSENAIIKKGVAVYNNISWSNSNEMDNEKGGAVEKARNFSIRNNYSTVISTLCYGVQWDTALQFIDNNYIGFAKNSLNMGWYSNNSNNSIQLTGCKGTENKQKNIYDMAGNVWEWTMEAYNTNNRIYRGGRYDVDATLTPASSRANNVQLGIGKDLGFRICLYII